jgi:membrane-associated protease RseP (regulator of RpoE activity)
VRLLRVHPGGPGDKAGFQVGDAILAIGGMRITQMADIANLLDIYKPGDKVLVQVFRRGQVKKIELTLGMRPSSGELAAGPGVVPPPPPPQPTLPPQPQVLVPPPQVRVGPGEGPMLTPPAPTAEQLRMEQLQRRIEQLERRVEQLERQRPAKGVDGK